MKRTLIMLVSMFFLLSGCSEETNTANKSSEHAPTQKAIEFSQGNQKFRIIPFNNEVLEYTETVNKKSNLDVNKIYDDKVIKQFRKKVMEYDLNLKNDFSQFLSPTQYALDLNVNASKLLKREKKINEAIKQSLIDSSNILSGGDKTVLVMPANPEVPIEETDGVSGLTISDNFILIQIDPSVTEEHLKYAIAHEYHHTINIEKNSIGSSVLDGVIFEGKADSFAHIVYPKTVVQWTKPIADEEIKDALSALKNESVFYNQLMLGDSAKNIPARSNYIIGYKIMQSYLKKYPKVKIEDWTTLAPNEILKNSTY
ncbi:DUF2268 domain-containing protein [Peribacillus sp. SCS-26]|uniref:DUF2268 domain-containing protein n=1 Tax=Paraperibacillus marinus TaxID=3115295 RepID=UPI0039062AFD